MSFRSSSCKLNHESRLWKLIFEEIRMVWSRRTTLASSFGQKYTLSVDDAMTVVLNLLDEDAKELLYKIALFDGPFIQLTLLQLFLTCSLPNNKKLKIEKSKRSLVAKGLVRLESQMFGQKVRDPKDSNL
jgi:hypothetical protein